MITHKSKAGKRAYVKSVLVVALLAAWVSIPFLTAKTSADALSDTRIGATLTGAAIGGVTPSGFAEHRLDDQGRRRLKADGSSINLPAGTVLQISVNGTVIGQAGVS